MTGSALRPWSPSNDPTAALIGREIAHTVDAFVSKPLRPLHRRRFSHDARGQLPKRHQFKIALSVISPARVIDALLDIVRHKVLHHSSPQSTLRDEPWKNLAVTARTFSEQTAEIFFLTSEAA